MGKKTSMTIPKKVKIIASGAFNECTSLSSTEWIKEKREEDPMVIVNADEYEKEILNINIPSSVTYIGRCALSRAYFNKKNYKKGKPVIYNNILYDGHGCQLTLNVKKDHMRNSMQSIMELTTT